MMVLHGPHHGSEQVRPMGFRFIIDPATLPRESGQNDREALKALGQKIASSLGLNEEAVAAHGSIPYGTKEKPDFKKVIDITFDPRGLHGQEGCDIINAITNPIYTLKSARSASQVSQVQK